MRPFITKESVMSVSDTFSKTNSKGFYVADKPLTEESILAMAKASETKTQEEEARLKSLARHF